MFANIPLIFIYLKTRKNYGESILNIKYEGELVNVNVRHVTFEPGGKNIYFSTYPPPTLTHLSYRFISVSKPAI
jgi:hypothetical protein